MKTICLNMIVKNEAPIIANLLKSVKDVVDYYVIVDTGSDDGTPEVIKKIMDEYNIDGEIHHEEWVNFGFNRQQALDKSIGKADYALIIDADEEIKYSDINTIKNLTKEAYYIKQFFGGIEYFLPKLVKIRDNSCGWKWVGAVHEYLHSPNNKVTKNKLDEKILHIISHCHIGNRSTSCTIEEKYLKDAKLLLSETEKHPNDPRTVFYLAQSYRDAQKFEESIKWYKKRVEMGGWEEEVYISLYNIAMCKIRMKKYDFETVILFDLLKAFNYRKSRLEALFIIVNTYRLNGAFREAFSYGMLGFGLDKPTDLLFVEKRVHNFGLIDELAISAFYCGHYEIAKELGEKILREKKYPATDELRLKKNLQFSLDKLEEQRNTKKEIISV